MLQKWIPTSLKSFLQKRPSGFGRDWRKRAWILLGILAATFILGHLGVRYVLWPQIEKSKPTLERLISARLGVNVTMDEVQVSWTGIRPSFEAQGLRFNPANGLPPPLLIKNIRGELSWLSFYHLSPYFHEIIIDEVQIHVQRDINGSISVAGIPIHSKENDFSAENWLMDQKEIDINHATVFWEDQKSRNLKTAINIQNFRLSNGIRRHLGELTATVPWSPSPINLQASFVHHLGGQAGNWRDWIGTFSWNVSEINLGQILKDIPLPLHDLQGILSTKGSIKLDGGKADGGEMYLAADNLKAQLNKDEDPLEFGRLETNLTQVTKGDLFSITTKTLAWREIDSPSSSPLDTLSPITFRWRPPEAGGELKEFGFSSPKILVEDIALFALNLPLPKKIHQWIKTSEADGELENLDINWSESKTGLAGLSLPGNWLSSSKLDFSISAKLNDVSFTSINNSMPTVSNLSGTLTSNQKQGNFSISSKNLDFEMADFLSSPQIQLDSAKGEISWIKEKNGWQIDIKQLQLSNSEVTTIFDLSYLASNNAKQADQMTLDMQFPKAKLATAHRYLPVAMEKGARQYFAKAFEAGVIQDGSLHIKGDPSHIPFPAGKTGELTLNLPISGAIFKPAPLHPVNQGVWSTFTNVTGTIGMQQASLNIDIAKANYKKVLVTNVHAQIPSVSAKQFTLLLNGAIEGDGPEVLEYVYASPIGVQQTSLAKNLSIAGPVNVDIAVKTPLSGNDDPQFEAKINFPGNKVQWGDIPPLDNLKGKVRITEASPEFEGVSANFLGGSVKISSAPSTGENSSFSINGNLSANFIKDYISSNLKSQVNPILLGMSGSSNYEGLINFNKEGSQTNLKFDLRNWASTAPAPANKLAGAPMVGQINLRTYPTKKPGALRAEWSGKFGEQYFLQGNMGMNNEFKNAFNVGSPAVVPPQGFALHLAVNEFDMDAWLDFMSSAKARSKSKNSQDVITPQSGVQISAQIKKLIALDREWSDFNFNGVDKNQVWQLRLNSPQIAGQLQWHPANNQHPSSLITGRLARLKFPEPIEDVAIPKIENVKSPSAQKKSSLANFTYNPNSIPSLDLTIDDLHWKKSSLGAMKVKSKTTLDFLQLEALQLINPQGVSNATGQWAIKPKNNLEQNSSINIDMNIKDAGQIVGRWSSANLVEGGQGKLNAKLNWSGPLFSPQLDTLEGNVAINLEKGRLLEVNSNAAKLLNVLSLQSLFKFATLDLQGSIGNIATKGSPFSSINSNFDIANGVAKTKEFTMELDQARVLMSGQINIPQETQDFRVTIFPTIDTTAGSLAAFAINPLVGLSVVVGQYLITSQINRSMQSDYLIQGSWTDPEVIPLDQKGQPLDAKTLETIRTKNLLKEQSKPNAPTAPSSNPSVTGNTAS
jgi:uncharacterized protein (TIGR02099 family)